MAAERVQGRPTTHPLHLRPLTGSVFAYLASGMSAWTGGETALRLAATAHEDGTVEAYHRHWRRFCEWCALNHLEPLPATPLMVTAYIGWLAEHGTIAASSLQPYLSAINAMHADLGMPKPALGHLIQRARAGMRRGQALVQTRDMRIPLPPEVMLRVLTDTAGKARFAGAHWLRARYALLLTYLFMGRQDSCVSLLRGDHGITDDYLWLRITEKMKRGWAFRRIVRIPRVSAPALGHASVVGAVAAVGQAFVAARDTLPRATHCTHFFQLPGERPPRTSDMSAWLADALRDLGVSAPPGFAYLGHSLRSGASSAAEAIRISKYKGNWLGGWSQTGRTRELHYIDPSFQPTPASYAFFGWLLEGQYQALPPEWQPRRGAADDDEPGELHGH